jgi:protein-S-isoprenylcysteine O-methyltransferase Ste14
MFTRALLAFLALPGVVAFAVPIFWLIVTSHTRLAQPLGLVPLVVGCLALLWCVRDFYVRGKGTLAPWAPPVHLVVVGPYRYTRNPMYVAVTLILLGWAISFGLRGLYVYASSLRSRFTCASCSVRNHRLRVHMGLNGTSMLVAFRDGSGECHDYRDRAFSASPAPRAEATG